MRIKLPSFQVPYYVQTPRGRLVIRVCEKLGRTSTPFLISDSGVSYGARFMNRPERYLPLTDFARTQEELEPLHRDGITIRGGIKADPRWVEVFTALKSVPGVRIEE